MGIADLTSGTVSLNEVIRGLGALHKRRWKPLRTIAIASWDAEQPNSNLVRQHTLYRFFLTDLYRSAASASKLATSD